MPKGQWSQSEMRYLREHWATDGSKAVATALGLEWKNVQRKAKRMGLVSNKESRYKRSGATLASHNCSSDTDYFTREWSPNLAYIVGYIFADGCISKDWYSLGFLCHSKDEEILVAIHKELNVTTKIHRDPAREYGGRKNGPRTYFNVNNKQLVLSLRDRFGLVPQKTSLDLPMPEIPDAYVGHFVRGYFDGDGHVSVSKKHNGGRASFVGSETFVRQMSSAIGRLIGSDNVCLFRQGKVWSATWTLWESLEKIHKLIYPDGDYIYLSRKRQMFDLLIQRKAKPVATPWTQKEEDFLRKYYNDVPFDKIAKALGRSQSSVRYKVGILGLVAAQNKPRKNHVTMDPIT